MVIVLCARLCWAVEPGLNTKSCLATDASHGHPIEVCTFQMNISRQNLLKCTTHFISQESCTCIGVVFFSTCAQLLYSDIKIKVCIVELHAVQAGISVLQHQISVFWYSIRG